MSPSCLASPRSLSGTDFQLLSYCDSALSCGLSVPLTMKLSRVGELSAPDATSLSRRRRNSALDRELKRWSRAGCARALARRLCTGPACPLANRAGTGGPDAEPDCPAGVWLCVYRVVVKGAPAEDRAYLFLAERRDAESRSSPWSPAIRRLSAAERDS